MAIKFPGREKRLAHLHRVLKSQQIEAIHAAGERIRTRTLLRLKPSTDTTRANPERVKSPSGISRKRQKEST